MEIKFGKFKGGDDEQIAKTKEGASWMRWVMEQPIDPKYAEATKKRNARWETLLSGSPKKEPTQIKMEVQSDLKVFQASLDYIVKMLEEILQIAKGNVSRTTDEE